jgi:hypothetical protein
MVPTLKSATDKYVEVTHENGSTQRYTWRGLEKAAKLSAGMQALLEAAKKAPWGFELEGKEARD